MVIPVCVVYFTPIFLHILKCSSAYTLSCLFMYCSSANIGHADTMCSTVSSNCLQNLKLLSVSVIIFCRIIIIIIIIIIITFMHDVYNYMPETNHVSRVLYSVAAVLHWQFVLHVMLFRP